jgi:CRP-like cAMP-binding protein
MDEGIVHANATPLIQGFEALGLTPEEAVALHATMRPPRTLLAGTTLIREGDPPAGLYFVLGGVLKACRNLDNGVAQTLALFTPGDVVGAHGLALGQESATVAAVSECRVAQAPAGRLRDFVETHPHLADALWRALARQTAILQEWMVGLGRRPALNQIAHLLCEMAVRLSFRTLCDGVACDFPLTQGELSDAVGLSSVHVNRVLQSLRRDGLIELSRGQLTIRDWERLAAIADFDPSYLRRRPPGGEYEAFPFPSVDGRVSAGGRDRQPVAEHRSRVP